MTPLARRRHERTRRAAALLAMLPPQLGSASPDDGSRPAGAGDPLPVPRRPLRHVPRVPAQRTPSATDTAA